MNQLYGVEYGAINQQGVITWEPMEFVYFQGVAEVEKHLIHIGYQKTSKSGCYEWESEYNSLVARMVPLVPFEKIIPNQEKVLSTAKALGFEVIENSSTPGFFVKEKNGNKIKLNSSNNYGLSFLFDAQEETGAGQEAGIQPDDIIIERSTNRKLRVKSLMGNSSNVIDFLATYVSTTTKDVDGNPVYMDRGFKFHDEGTVWSKAGKKLKKLERKEDTSVCFTHSIVGALTKTQVEDSLSLLAEIVTNLNGLEVWEEYHAFRTDVEWEEEVLLRYQDLLRIKALYEPKLPLSLK